MRYQPRMYSANELSLRVLKYKLQGMSYDQIAKVLGIPKSHAIRVYTRSFKALKKEMADTARDALQLELARLDQMLMKLWHDSIEDVDGNPASKDRRARNIEVMLKIMERRAKYLGLDAPEKRVDVSVGVNLNELGVDELKVELEKMGFNPGADLPPLEYKLPGEVIIDSAPLTAEEAERHLDE